MCGFRFQLTTSRLDRLLRAALCCRTRTNRHTNKIDDKQNQIVIRNSQILLGLILPLLLIAVGLIDMGKRPGLNTM